MTEEKQTCKWKDKEDYWQTQCGESHSFFCDGPIENNHTFCPYCGDMIVVSDKREEHVAPSAFENCPQLEEFVLPDSDKKQDLVDVLIEELESLGLGWSLDHTGRLIEARVWDWPDVIGRYRPNKVEPLAQMLSKAMEDAGFDDSVKNINTNG